MAGAGLDKDISRLPVADNDVYCRGSLVTALLACYTRVCFVRGLPLSVYEFTYRTVASLWSVFPCFLPVSVLNCGG